MEFKQAPWLVSNMLGSFFKKKKGNESEESKKDLVIFFHEDFYRQIELVPEENYFERNSYIDGLPENEASSFGFENCIVREEHPFKTSMRQIPYREMAEVLEPLSHSFHTKVEAGYSTTSYRKENTVVWGFDRYGIFIETNQAELVQNIYLCHNHHFLKKNDGTELSKALSAISQKYKLVLIDWNQEVVIRASVKTKIDAYLIDTLNFSFID